MNIDFNNIPQWLWAFLISPIGIVLLIGIATIFLLKVLVGKKKEIDYVKAVLTSVHELMAGRLGDKAEAVYQAWLAGLDAVSDGDFTSAEMMAELVRCVKIALNKQNISLNSEEEAVIVEAASLTSQVVATNTKSTKKAVSIMMAK